MENVALAEESGAVARKPARQGVRALPGGYLVCLFVLSFVSALIGYLGYSTVGAALAVLAWAVIPFLWINDLIVFDGRRVKRIGLIPRLWARAMGLRDRLKLSDIEQVETVAFRGIKRGRNVYYTYRTTVTGKGVRFVFSSGHRGYVGIVRALFTGLQEDILDNTSIDLRDYLIERDDARRRAVEAEIPSSDVLDGALRDIRFDSRKGGEISSEESRKARQLRKLANELRLTGRLLQALEAFRRAALLRPRDARLLFEFASCLRLVAGSESDQRLGQKAMAMMRLAERHAAADPNLLVRIGETYFQIGEWRRASMVFRRVADSFGENFRILRGMAEIALREGKLAHVIHNFSAANRLAETGALRRWTQTELDYFSHLNDDEEYMELEISRVNLLDTLERTKRVSVRVVLIGLLAVLFGISVGDTVVANVGWAVSGISLVTWLVTLVLGKMLAPRIPFELVEEADE